MRISDRGIESIVAFEGLELNAYKCPAGVWTIGVGYTGGVSVPAPAYAVNSLFKVTEVDDAISVGDVVVGGISLSATAQGSIKGTVLR